MGLMSPLLALLKEQEYLHCKGYYSMGMQAPGDHRGQFMDANVGCTGKVHDARVFRQPGVYLHGQAETLFQMTMS